jgi:hypothetical protein
VAKTSKNGKCMGASSKRGSHVKNSLMKKLLNVKLNILKEFGEFWYC